MVSKTEEAVQRALVNGSVKETEWKGAVRTGELDNCVVGDILQMPKDKYTILSDTIRGSENTFQYAYVENQDGEPRRIFPSMFQRNVRIYTMGKDSVVTPTDKRAMASGTAVDLFKKAISIEEGMQSLLGKKLEIKKIERVQTRAYNSTTQLREQPVYTIDIVKK